MQTVTIKDTCTYIDFPGYVLSVEDCFTSVFHTQVIYSVKFRKMDFIVERGILESFEGHTRSTTTTLGLVTYHPLHDSVVYGRVICQNGYFQNKRVPFVQ